MRKKAKFLKFLILTISLCITASTAFASTDADIIEEWASHAMVSSFIKNWGAAKIIDRSDGNNYCIDQTDRYPHSYAWVPAHDENNPTQWVRLVYNTPVYPTKVKIIERYKAYDGEKNVSKIYFITVSGKKILAWQGDDTQKITWKLDSWGEPIHGRSQCGGIMELTQDDFTQEARNLTEPVDELLIEFQTHEGSWAGIDAVKLIGYQYRGDIIPQYNGRIITQHGIGTGEFDRSGYDRYRVLGRPVALNSVAYYDKRTECEIFTYHSNGPIDIFYKNPVFPFKLRIYEFWAVPGRDEIVKKIYFYTPSGRKVLAWQGNNVTANWKYDGFLEITKEDLTSEAQNLDEPIIKMRIYVDVSQYGNGDSHRDDWIGIDAVELVGSTKEKKSVPITEETIQDVMPPLPDISIGGINDYYYEGQSPQKINLSVNFNSENSTLYISEEGKYKDIHPDKRCEDELHYTLIQPIQVNRIVVGDKYSFDWSDFRLPKIKQIYFVTTEGQTTLVWEKNDNDSDYYAFYGMEAFSLEAENLTNVKEIIFKVKGEVCGYISSVTAIGNVGNDIVTVSLKKGEQTLLNKQLEFNSSQSVDIAISDDIKNQIASNPGIYTVEAIVGCEDNKKVVTKDFTVKAVTPHLALEGPDTVNILESSSVDINVNASVNPAESVYTLSQITYSIPELDITDQPVEDGKITIDNIDHPVAEVYHVTVKGCINELENRCTEESKNIRFTAPTPEIELSCPSSIYQGQDMTCQLNLTTPDYTPEQLQIEWLVDGQQQENATDATSFDYMFNNTGDHYVKAVAKLKNAPFIKNEKTAIINVILTQIRLNSPVCIYGTEWSKFWTQENVCPFGRDGSGGIKLDLVGNFHLTPKIKIVDADTEEVIKELQVEETPVQIKPEDINFSNVLQTKNLKIIAYYSEIPNKKDEKSISVILAPSIPEFEVNVDDSMKGKAVVNVAIKNYDPEIYGNNFKASVTGILNGGIDTTDYVNFDSSGKATINYTYHKEGNLTLTPKVALFYNNEIIKSFILPSQNVIAKLPTPIKLSIRSSNGFEGFPVFNSTVVAYPSSVTTWNRTKGLEWLLDNQTIAGGPDELVKSINLSLDQAGNHTLLVKAYHKNSEQVDIAGNATFKIFEPPSDVENAFDLKIAYKKDFITVSINKFYKSDELIKTPVREYYKSAQWIITDSSGNIIKSYNSININKISIDTSDWDLNKNYFVNEILYTNINRSFSSEKKDINESLIKTDGIDFSNADIEVKEINSKTRLISLEGISYLIFTSSHLKAHYDIYASNGTKVFSADSKSFQYHFPENDTKYTIKGLVKNSDGEVLWQKSVDVVLNDSNNNQGQQDNNSNVGNGDTKNNNTRKSNSNIDFSNADIEVKEINSKTHLINLKGISYLIFTSSHLKAHYDIYASNGTKVFSADSKSFQYHFPENDTKYTIKGLVKNSDDEVLWQKSVDVVLNDSNNNQGQQDNNSSSNNTANNNNTDHEMIDNILNKVEFNCQVVNPFIRKVKCSVSHLYTIVPKLHGYDINYCVLSLSYPNFLEMIHHRICGKRYTYYTFDIGGDKDFLFGLTYKKGDYSRTIQRRARVHLPASINELFEDPEKGLYAKVEFINPDNNNIAITVGFKDNHYNLSFSTYYYYRISLINMDKEDVLITKKSSRLTYQIPVSSSLQYGVKVDILKKDTDELVYSKILTTFDKNTILQNMGDLEIQKLTGRFTSWGTYKLNTHIHPSQLRRFLLWEAIVKDSQGHEIEKYNNFSWKILHLPTVGDYTITLQIHSKKYPDDVLATKTYTIHATNQKPQIEISELKTYKNFWNHSNLYIWIKATDPDGRIKSKEITACNKTIKMNKCIFSCGTANEADINIKVCDDANECTEMTKHVQWDQNDTNN